jgi:hypothetical protein
MFLCLCHKCVPGFTCSNYSLLPCITLSYMYPYGRHVDDLQWPYLWIWFPLWGIGITIKSLVHYISVQKQTRKLEWTVIMLALRYMYNACFDWLNSWWQYDCFNCHVNGQRYSVVLASKYLIKAIYSSCLCLCIAQCDINTEEYLSSQRIG